MARRSKLLKSGIVVVGIVAVAAIGGVGANWSGNGYDWQAKAGDLNKTGGAGNNSFNGNDSANNLQGGAGSDKLFGRGGNDILGGDDGDDSVYGHEGNDQIGGGNGDDDLYGGDGNDTINGGAGGDSIDTGSGNDTVHGGDGGDLITVRGVGDSTGDGGNDYFYLGAALAGARAFGNDGDDTFLANEPTSGDPVLTIGCGAGNDTVYAGKNDSVAADCENVYRGARPTVTATAPATVYTASVPVTISVSDKDNDVAQMRVWQVDGAASQPGAWVPYSASTTFNVSGAFGTKVIVVNVKDTGGNEAGTFFAVDWKNGHPPKITALGGATDFVTSPATVNVATTDPDNDVTQVRTGVFGYAEWSEWKPLTASVEIPLTGGTGGRALLVQVRDSKGNESAPEVKYINFGKPADPPGTAPKITSVKAPATVTKPEVPVTVTATDAENDIKEIRSGVFGYAEFGAWKPYNGSGTITVDLPGGGYGSRAVLVQVRDAKGNESVADVVYVTIRKVTAPTLVSVSAPAAVSSPNVNVAVNATDPDKDINELRTRATKSGAAKGGWSDWKTYGPAVEVALGSETGTYEVEVQVRDAEGLESGVLTDSVTYGAAASANEGADDDSGNGDTGDDDAGGDTSEDTTTPAKDEPKGGTTEDVKVNKFPMLYDKAKGFTYFDCKDQKPGKKAVKLGSKTWYCATKIPGRYADKVATKNGTGFACYTSRRQPGANKPQNGIVAERDTWFCKKWDKTKKVTKAVIVLGPSAPGQ